MLDLLMKRRSCRKFEDRKVEEEKINKILIAAQLAPSGKNTKPWEFIVIEDQETLQKLGQCRQPQQAFLPNTPLAIVILGNISKTDTWVEDTSIATTLMQLEAESLGLGSCWVQIRLRESNQNMSSEDYVRKLLQVPKHLSVLCILAVGYPTQQLPEHTLDEVQGERIHKEIY